jgi:signal transduction histidine kinase
MKEQLLRAGVPSRIQQLTEEHLQLVRAGTDRMFAGLMAGQYVVTVLIALLISPKTWDGAASRVHPHLWAALVFGFVIAALPIYFSLTRPGRTETRHVNAAGQVLFSALLIHVTGGRIETHFHIFGSLAILAFYRDWRVIITASAIVALDHLLRGFFLPESVYGVLWSPWWRTAEHAAWVVFEDIFLCLSIRRGIGDMRDLASHQVELEIANSVVEQKVQDRTRELEKAQAKLVQSGKMAAVGQLAAGIAHEINNPLGVILGFAQALSRQITTENALGLPIKSIEREALRCRDLVQELLIFSRTSQSDREALDLNHTIAQTMTLMQTQSKIPQVQIERRLAEGLPRILGNENQIQQILLNLSKNAIDAMPGGGRMTITTELLQDAPYSWVCLKVADTGTGIPAEISTKIFDPFFTTKPVGQGTGLGLSLISEIVSKHSGTIEVESRPGCTVFSVKFPAKSMSALKEHAGSF